MPNKFAALRKKAGLTIREAADILELDTRTIYRYENGSTPPKKPVIITLESIIKNKQKRRINKDNFTFIDLFAGIGGLRKGFDDIGGKCVFTSEWDKYSQETYKANFPDDDHEIAGDITRISAEEIPVHDVLLAGFPCQPFSIAGVSKKNSLNRAHGFKCEAQGTLFFDVARIIEHHRPKAFLLENVKNLISHDKGRTFNVIYRTLTEELGYNVHYRIIDAKYWVPQHRERIFIVGFKNDNGFSFDDFELPNEINIPKLKTILHPEDGSEAPDAPFIEGRKGYVSGKYTLSNHLWDYLQAYAEKHRKKGNGFGFGLVTHDSTTRTLSARYYKDGSEILVAQGKRNPRRLTPRECARLMGFEKAGENKFVIPVSDTQAYRQFGNSVVVPVVEAVARHMEEYINEAIESEVFINKLKASAVG